jgi:hypothetical protein
MPGVFTPGQNVVWPFKEAILKQPVPNGCVVLAEEQPGLYRVATNMGINVLVTEADLTAAVGAVVTPDVQQNLDQLASVQTAIIQALPTTGETDGGGPAPVTG